MSYVLAYSLYHDTISYFIFSLLFSVFLLLPFIFLFASLAVNSLSLHEESVAQFSNTRQLAVEGS